MSKYTRFTTNKRVPITFWIGQGKSVVFQSREYTTDDKEEIELLKAMAKAGDEGIRFDPDNATVDYLTSRYPTRQPVRHATKGIQSSTTNAPQHVSITQSKPQHQRIATPAALDAVAVPQAQRVEEAKDTKEAAVSAEDAAAIVKSVAPKQGEVPAAPVNPLSGK